MSRTLIIIGLVFVAAGVLWPFMGRLGLGRLPGDIVIERPGFSFYFQLMTSLIISVVLSVLLWLINR
jgi:membrane protein implicated in regulation of membrane protease activity